MKLFLNIIYLAIGLHSIAANATAVGKPKLSYCRGYTDPHFITFFDPNAQLCTDLGWQTMLRNAVLEVSIDVGPVKWTIDDFKIDIFGNNWCTIDVYCLLQNICCQNNPGVNIYQVGADEYAVEYQPHFSATIWKHPSGNALYRFDIDLWQPWSYNGQSSGICVKGCGSAGAGRRRRRRQDGGEICQTYQEVALSLTEKVGRGAKVDDITRRNAEESCRFDVETTGLEEIAQSTIPLILTSALNGLDPSLDELPKLIKQVAELTAEGLKIVNKRGK